MRAEPGGAGRRKAGRADRADLSGLTRHELYERAAKVGVPGRSRMNRAELEKAVRKAA